jgi:hypothetical protein
MFKRQMNRARHEVQQTVMTRPHTLLPPAFVALLAAFAVSGPAPAAQTPAAAPRNAEDSIALFDGKSMHGWRAYKRPDATGTRWRVEDGMLTLPPNDGKDTRGARDIITMDTFDLFDLSWEWKAAQGANSGVKYFVLEDMDSAIGHEYQIIDDERHADAKIGPHRQTAAFYDVLAAGTGTFTQQVAAPAVRPLKPAGEWNTSRVRIAPSRVVSGGTRVYHYLNNVRVLEYELDSAELRAAIAKSKFKDVGRFGKLQKGHILLQDHGDQVWYRNIRIQRLNKTS